jgi:hypothetical protein
MFFALTMLGLFWSPIIGGLGKLFARPDVPRERDD